MSSLYSKYETRAVELLSWYYKKDAAISVDIVQTRIALWGNKNLVTLAANGDSRAFVAHPCCQEHLTNVWLGRVGIWGCHANFNAPCQQYELLLAFVFPFRVDYVTLLLNHL